MIFFFVLGKLMCKMFLELKTNNDVLKAQHSSSATTLSPTTNCRHRNHTALASNQHTHPGAEGGWGKRQQPHLQPLPGRPMVWLDVLAAHPASSNHKLPRHNQQRGGWVFARGHEVGISHQDSD